MKFNLKDFDHLRDDPTVQFKEEIVDGIELVTVCYMISNDELWKKPLGRETRGHSFYKSSGNLVSMAFDKFFNIFEKEETLPHNIDWTRPIEVFEKRDGSMITGAIINDNVHFKTKKSFYSDVAILANKIAPENVRELTKSFLSYGMSPIWEFTHPDWKIVVDYVEPTWTLLAIRHMDDGDYFGWSHLDDVANNYDINMISRHHDITSYDELHTSITNMTGAEGYVVHFPLTGFRVKTKCKWYNDRHHINTDLREREVARFTAEETMDDVISTIMELGYDLSKVTEIQNRVVADFVYMKGMAESMVEKVSSYPSKKDAAIAHSKEKWFGEAIRLVGGRDVDYLKIWMNEYKQNYSLRTVYSDFNHTQVNDEA